jgi:hypothetical protein
VWGSKYKESKIILIDGPVWTVFLESERKLGHLPGIGQLSKAAYIFAQSGDILQSCILARRPRAGLFGEQ